MSLLLRKDDIDDTMILDERSKGSTTAGLLIKVAVPLRGHQWTPLPLCPALQQPDPPCYLISVANASSFSQRSQLIRAVNDTGF